MVEHPGFADIGKRMLLTWQEGLAGLREKRTYAMGDGAMGEAFTAFSDPQPAKKKPRVIGRSDLIGSGR